MTQFGDHNPIDIIKMQKHNLQSFEELRAGLAELKNNLANWRKAAAAGCVDPDFFRSNIIPLPENPGEPEENSDERRLA